MKSGKHSADRLEKDLEKVKHEALIRIDQRHYRERVPLHTKGPRVRTYSQILCCSSAYFEMQRESLRDRRLAGGHQFRVFRLGCLRLYG
jgi:hypothetical protein